MPMTRTQLALSNVGCLVTLLLSLLDANIVGAVTYPMVHDLDPVHGVAHLPWLVIGYTLADCVVLPIYGKLADAYGAKRIYLVALSVFIVGSALCGLSTNLTELIAFRTLQGFGGGGLIATTMVILGLLQRGTDQATGQQGTMRTSMGGVMVGVGMALGPTVGECPCCRPDCGCSPWPPVFSPRQSCPGRSWPGGANTGTCSSSATPRPPSPWPCSR
jgi:MFS family permease